MASGIQRDIGTRFTVSGMRETMAELGRLRSQFRTFYADLRRDSRNPLDGLLTSVQNVDRSLRRITWRGIGAGSNLAFKGFTLAAAGAAAQVSAIGAAAVASNKDISELLNKMKQDSRRTGLSTQALSTLKFAGEMNDVDYEEVRNQVSHLQDVFGNVWKAWDKGNAEFNDFFNRAPKLYAAAISAGDTAAAQEVFSQFEEKVSQSMGALDERIARAQTLEDKKKYQDQRQSLIDSWGPEAQAIFELQDTVGIDMAELQKGVGFDFLALSDSFQKIQDPIQRTRLSMRLFGEDAGPKMIPLLMAGRKGLMAYRRQLEELGAVITPEDAERGADFQKSLKGLQTAIFGARLAFSRESLPLMTDTVNELTQWTSKNRQLIAAYGKEVFVDLRNFAYDTIGLINGQNSNFRGDFFTRYQEQIVAIRNNIVAFGDELDLVFQHKKSNWPWLNGIVAIVTNIRDVFHDIFSLIGGGQATNFTELNFVAEFLDDLGETVYWVYTLFKDWFHLVQDFAEVVDPFLEDFGLSVNKIGAILIVGQMTGALGGMLKVISGIGSAITGWQTILTGAATAGVNPLVFAFGQLSAAVAPFTAMLALLGGLAIPPAVEKLLSLMGIQFSFGEFGMSVWNGAQGMINDENGREMNESIRAVRASDEAYLREKEAQFRRGEISYNPNLYGRDTPLMLPTGDQVKPWQQAMVAEALKNAPPPVTGSVDVNLKLGDKTFPLKAAPPTATDLIESIRRAERMGVEF